MAIACLLSEDNMRTRPPYAIRGAVTPSESGDAYRADRPRDHATRSEPSAQPFAASGTRMVPMAGQICPVAQRVEVVSKTEIRIGHTL